MDFFNLLLHLMTRSLFWMGQGPTSVPVMLSNPSAWAASHQSPTVLCRLSPPNKKYWRGGETSLYNHARAPGPDNVRARASESLKAYKQASELGRLHKPHICQGTVMTVSGCVHIPLGFNSIRCRTCCGQSLHAVLHLRIFKKPCHKNNLGQQHRCP